MTTAPVHKLTVTEKVGYGFGDLASNLFWQMFSIFIAKYYTDVFLLGAATMGTMLLVTRIGDAFIDPVIGAMADRTRTRWGFFRPYLLWMAIPMALTAIATFTVPSFGGTGRVVYAYVTLSLMMIAYSAINIPYSALLGVLTPSSEDRTSASSYRFVMALLPVFVIVNTAIPMAQHFGGGDVNSAAGWQMTMIIYSVAAVLLYWLTFAMTTERVQPEPGQKSSLKNDIKDLFANRPWVVLCVVGIAALTYANIRGTVAIFYFENVVPGGKDYFGPIMTTGAIAFIVGVMITAPLSKIFGKRNFYMFSMALTALFSAAFYWVPAQNIALVWAAHALISFCAAPTAPLVWAMYADTADYSEWKCGRRATGLIFSAASFAQKFGWAIGGAGTGWLLAYFGYQPNAVQSAHTIDGIMLMMSLIPTVGAVIAIAALWFYELDEPKVKAMGEDLARRRAHEPDSATTTSSALPIVSATTSQPAALSTPPISQEPSVIDITTPSLAPATAEGQRAPSAPHNPAFGAGHGQLPGGFVPGASTGVPVAPPVLLTPEQLATLQGEFSTVLNAGVHGLCFSPYLQGQSPGDQIPAAQIQARLEVIRPYSGWIRSFSCTDGHEQTPAIAKAMGLKTLVGAWLGTDREINEREIEGVIAVARAGHADIVAVGNEVLLREDMSEDELLAHIQRVKDALPGIAVGYVDAYFLFEKHPRVTAACDVILTNCYPFWEGCPRDQALAYMQGMYARTQAVAAGKRVIISETGWPDKGSPFHGAVPSTEGAMRYFIDTNNWAKQDGVEVFYFAAFDEAWKVGAEGDVGAYWGLWDTNATPKYTGKDGA
jgi:sugar (glycoside-pentoside-hexuronide) transporter